MLYRPTRVYIYLSFEILLHFLHRTQMCTVGSTESGSIHKGQRGWTTGQQSNIKIQNSSELRVCWSISWLPFLLYPLVCCPILYIRLLPLFFVVCLLCKQNHSYKNERVVCHRIFTLCGGVYRKIEPPLHASISSEPHEKRKYQLCSSSSIACRPLVFIPPLSNDVKDKKKN